MKRLPGRLASVLFIKLVSLIGLAFVAFAGYVTATRYASSMNWLLHTREVETKLSQMRAGMARTDAARLNFILTDDPISLDRFHELFQEISPELAEIEHLMQDNSVQRENLNKLVPLIHRRMGFMQESIALKIDHPANAQQQNEITITITQEGREAAAIMQNMQEEEESLLQQRTTITQQKYRALQSVFLVALALIALLLAMNFHSLVLEARERQIVEDALRRLSARILRVQDADRRHVARELHDSIGQLFAALGMNLSVIKGAESIPEPIRNLAVECLRITEQGLTETRTISYLLHPPMLDEMGFATAARWYIDGFSERSKIQVHLKVPSDMGRMPGDIELVLFRVLQETLTNIHRHSGSLSADVWVESPGDNVTMRIRDYGRGISEELLERLQKSAAGTGVGLNGMRERVSELGGHLKIESSPAGTCVSVTMPTSHPAAEVSASPLLSLSPVQETQTHEAEN